MYKYKIYLSCIIVLFDKERVSNPPRNHKNYNIFYQLVSSLKDPVLRDMQLDTKFKILPEISEDEKLQYQLDFTRTKVFIYFLIK